MADPLSDSIMEAAAAAEPPQILWLDPEEGQIQGLAVRTRAVQEAEVAEEV